MTISPNTAPPVAAHSAAAPVPQYHAALAGPTVKPWRGIVALITFVAGFLVLQVVAYLVAVGIDVGTGTITVDQVEAGELTFTPVVFIAGNLALAALIPLSMLIQRVVFGVPMRQLYSVSGRFRWRLVARLLLVVVPIMSVYLAFSFIVAGEPLVPVTAGTVVLLALVVVTTPLQAAGEEFGFRGLVARAVGSWFKSSRLAFVVATIVSTAFFAFVHFAADPWLIAFYIVFGVLMSILALVTAGLEAAIVIHAVNNLFLFFPVVLMGQLDMVADRSEGAGGPIVLVGMAAISVMTVACILVYRREVRLTPTATAEESPGVVAK